MRRLWPVLLLAGCQTDVKFSQNNGDYAPPAVLSYASQSRFGITVDLADHLAYVSADGQMPRLFGEMPIGMSRTKCSLKGIRTASPQLQRIDLPPSGWAVFTRDRKLFSFSAMVGTNRTDYLRSAAYIYLDGRGHWFDAPEAGANGALAIRPIGKHLLQVIRISSDGAFVIRRPYHMRGTCLVTEAFDVDGKSLGTPIYTDTGTETRIAPLEKAIRYVLRFRR
jgi:hypothetical protein